MPVFWNTVLDSLPRFLGLRRRLLHGFRYGERLFDPFIDPADEGRYLGSAFVLVANVVQQRSPFVKAECGDIELAGNDVEDVVGERGESGNFALHLRNSVLDSGVRFLLPFACCSLFACGHPAILRRLGITENPRCFDRLRTAVWSAV